MGISIHVDDTCVGRDELSLTPFFVGVLSSMEGFGALLGALFITRLPLKKFFSGYARMHNFISLRIAYLAF